jgi:hypothetical protein
MANHKSDVFLRENRVSVVGGGGKERVNGTERGDLEVKAGKNKKPSIRLNADWANLVLGGGEGKSTEGDLKIRDSDDNNRVLATAEDNNSPDGDTRVWINGGNGAVKLGQSDTQSGNENIRLDPSTANIELGGPDGEAGEIVVRDLNDDEAISVSATSDEAERGPEISTENVALYEYTRDSQVGGIGAFQDGNATSVEIQGNSASIRLGYSYMETTDTGGPVGTGVPVGRGKGGSILLDDGNPGHVLANSQLFEVRASEGTFQISTSSELSSALSGMSSGALVFEIDPSSKALKIPEGWTIDKSLPSSSP